MLGLWLCIHDVATKNIGAPSVTASGNPREIGGG